MNRMLRVQAKNNHSFIPSPQERLGSRIQPVSPHAWAKSGSREDRACTCQTGGWTLHSRLAQRLQRGPAGGQTGLQSGYEHSAQRSAARDWVQAALVSSCVALSR